MQSQFLTRLIPCLVFFYCILWTPSAVAQKISINGIVKDEISQTAIRDVNIKVNGTREGAFTGQDGRFTLSLKKTPASITLSCIGYETVYYDIDKVPSKPLMLILRKTAYMLQEVDIAAKKYSYIFRDLNYSVLDYELTDDNILLLIFRYQLKRAELILLSLTGDTIAIVPVPEQKPKQLFKDFLGNVHYISTKLNAFQFYYNDTVNQSGFIYKTTFDSLYRMVKPFLFSIGDHAYFQEFTPDGFGTSIGYYDNDHRKKYIRYVSGESIRKNYYNDLNFYNQWNSHLQGANLLLQASAFEPHGNSMKMIEHTESRNPALVDEYDLRAHKQFSYMRTNAPLVKMGENSMAVFNFPEDAIEIMNYEGKVYKKIPITFHKENEDNLIASLLSAIVPVSDWKWRGKILVDEYYRAAYTTFWKNGIVKIRKINLETGQLTSSFDLPFPFPEKIQIYKGDAYFLIRNDDVSDKWKLVRYKL